MDLGWSRRALLRAVAAAGAAPALPAQKEQVSEDEWIARLEAFYQETDNRPEFVWMNREDVMYHDLDYPAGVAAAPEYCCFLRQAWVFNRAMEWVREDGTILCYEAAGDLPLTGEKSVSAWFTGPANQTAQEGEYTRFEKRSPRRRDCLVLPAFQFHAGQHPVVEIEVGEANADWQFCVSLKGRSGKPLAATAWQSGPGRARIDLAAELANRGFDWNFPEAHFIVGTWHAERSHPSRLRFRVRMPGRASVVACLPVVRAGAGASSTGVPVTAVAVDAQGKRLGSDRVRLYAVAGELKTPLAESGGVWKARLHGLPGGDHSVTIIAEGAALAGARTEVRLTDGRFYTLSKSGHWFSRDGKPAGPLTGSYQGTFYFRNAGGPGEKLVQGQREWDGWDRSGAENEHMHFWESLASDELDERFQLLERCGWDLVTLHSEWGAWERLDAGGRIAPHAAEQLARYLRIAGRHGLANLQALSSGPYGDPDHKPGYGGTVPYSVYLDAGFETRHFLEPGTNTRFEEMWHQYLRDFATLFAEEPALFALTTNGEGDHFVGSARCNDAMNTVRRIDRNHVYLAEAILMPRKLPRKHCQGYEQDRFGSRTYGIGTRFLPELDLGVEFKLWRMDNIYMAEGSWPPMPSYNRFHAEVLQNITTPRCWTGTDLYRTRLRDSLCLGLVHLMPVMNTWDEQMSEDEHWIVRQVRDHIDWHQRFAEPAIAIRIDDDGANSGGAHRAILVDYEKAFAGMGLMYRLIAREDPIPPGARHVIDGTRPYQPVRFASQGGDIPDDLQKAVLLQPPKGFYVNYSWAEDRRTVLAYVANATNHLRDRIMLGGQYHRMPKPAPLRIRLQNLPPSDLAITVYDLNAKSVVRETTAQGAAEFDLGITAHDYFVLVRPAKA